MNSHIRKIMAEVAAKHGVTAHDIIETSRYRPIVSARHEVFYRICQERRYSTNRVARIFGRNDTSVRYAVGCHAMRNAVALRLSCRIYVKKAEANRMRSRRTVAA